MKRVTLCLTVLFFLRQSAFASDVYDLLKHLPIQRDNVTGTQTINNGHLYAATVNAVVKDGDEQPNNHNFSDADTLESLTLSSKGGTLSFEPGNKSDIKAFAQGHAQEIYNILFPGGFTANIMGQSDSQLISAFTFDNVVAPLQSARSLQLREFRNHLSGRVEYDDIEINNRHGYSIGGLLDY